MKRVASVIGLPRHNHAEYDRYHAAPWPTVLERLARSNVHNYSIFRHGELLFSYFEYTGEDYEADMTALAADPETQRWWDVVKPLQTPLHDGESGSWWTDIPEVFHTD